MNPSNSIRSRLVAAYVLLALIIGGVFAGAAFFIILEIESDLIDSRLSRAAELWRADEYNPELRQTIDLRFYKGRNIPKRFRSLAIGTHELHSKGRGLHVLIGEANGDLFAIVNDQSDYELIELSSYLALVVAFFGGIALAVLIGRFSAGRVILPLTDLASAVQNRPQNGVLPGLKAKDEIGVLARAIDDSSRKLDLALQRERWFAADVSHELRTPLTIMLGAAEILISRLHDRPDLMVMAERIRRNAADTALQVSALLQLSRTPQRSEFIKVSLRPLIEQEVVRCQPLLATKSLNLEFAAGEDVSVQAVPELVAIAVSNLLRNACQYTEQGTIIVDLKPAQLVVMDSGAGLSESVRARLFDPFVRDAEEFTSGSGLGLSIVKRVTEYLGWTILYDHEADNGSRFTLLFHPF